MRRIIIFSLLLVVIVHAQAAQLAPINIEINPVVQWTDIDSPSMGVCRLSYVEITLPQITLAPADTFSINVHFTDSKMLQVINNPQGVSFDLILRGSGVYSTPPRTGDGLWNLDFHNYYGWLSPHTNGDLWVDSEPKPIHMWSVNPFLTWDPIFDGAENGSCFGDFTLSIKMPSYVLSPPDILPIEITTFTNNSIKLYARNGGGWTDPLTLQVVPEPATLFLLTLGGLILRKRKA